MKMPKFKKNAKAGLYSKPNKGLGFSTKKGVVKRGCLRVNFLCPCRLDRKRRFSASVG